MSSCVSFFEGSTVSVVTSRKLQYIGQQSSNRTVATVVTFKSQLLILLSLAISQHFHPSY